MGQCGRAQVNNDVIGRIGRRIDTAIFEKCVTVCIGEAVVKFKAWSRACGQRPMVRGVSSGQARPGGLL